MRTIARWCVRHRLAVLGMWLVVLVATFFAHSVRQQLRDQHDPFRHTERGRAQSLATRGAEPIRRPRADRLPGEGGEYRIACS